MSEPFEPTQEYRRIRFWVNPFFASALGFGTTLLIYSFGYSTLYPDISASLTFFILLTTAISLGLCGLISFVRYVMPEEEERFRKNAFIFAGIALLLVVDVLYSGVVPLWVMLRGGTYDYKEFGAPTLHVAYIGFNFFYATYWWDVALRQRDRRFIALAAFALFSAILIMNRGALVITALAMVAVYFYHRNFNRTGIVTATVLLFAFAWGFGWLGNTRMAAATAYRSFDSREVILKIGRASESFRRSGIPSEFFWSYLYVSSPIANLQLNVSDASPRSTPGDFAALNLLPDFISKHLLSQSKIDSYRPALITPELNVASMYGRPFAMGGWLGAWIAYANYVVVSLLTILFLRRTRYFVAAVSILSAMAALSIFDTMFTFTGAILQIYVALTLAAFEKVRTTI